MNLNISNELKNLSEEHPILFFDGVCNLCNATIQWIIKNDPNHIFRFTTLQDHISSENYNSVLALYQGKKYEESEVVLLVLQQLNKYWLLRKLAHFTPKRIADRIYQWVANNRYSWFGKKDHCMLPSEEIKKLFV